MRSNHVLDTSLSVTECVSRISAYWSVQGKLQRERYLIKGVVLNPDKGQFKLALVPQDSGVKVAEAAGRMSTGGSHTSVDVRITVLSFEETAIGIVAVCAALLVVLFVTGWSLVVVALVFFLWVLLVHIDTAFRYRDILLQSVLDLFETSHQF
jgi:hypothetical protein